MDSRIRVDLAAGGWVILASLALCAVVLLWQLSSVWQHLGSRAIGDGSSVASYGFDLSALTVPGKNLVAAGIPKDGLRALVAPRVVSAARVEEMRERRRVKFLVPSDRVIGVSIAGEARAYPLRVLAWHEIANDKLGGRPIAVTYSPLCDSAAVFDRLVEGEVVEFGVSGLLLNSNLVMYDRRSSPASESLWSQLMFEAIAGPAAIAGRRLAVLPALVVRWEEWRKLHPNTTVITGLPRLRDAYKRDPYVSYYGSDQLRFPVAPLPRGGHWRLKTPVLVVGVAGKREVYPLPVIARMAGPDHQWETRLGGKRLRFTYSEFPPAAWVQALDEEPLEIAYAFWFAWYSMHPSASLWSDRRGATAAGR